MIPSDIENVMANCYKEYARYAVMFMFFFFFRCALIHFGYKGVPNPWIIDASWYFGTMIGVILLIPIMYLFREYKR